jgi:Putative transposase/Transposase zinc-binding domain
MPTCGEALGLTNQQRKAVSAIVRCRTGELGYLEASCSCGYNVQIPCSCRNRHCPECQSEAAMQWRRRYEVRLPEIPTYHAVFTVPDSLRYFFRACPRQMYSLLFKSVRITLQRFCDRDRRLQGARLGTVAVLHTWGEELQFHPHLHLLICGGGFTPGGDWKSIDPRRGYLFSRAALAGVFRGLMLKALEKFIEEHRCWFHAPVEQLHSLLRRAALKNWGVFVQRSRSNSLCALAYLGRYSHRVAISPARILGYDEHSVTIARKGSGSFRLSPAEFVRRFLRHVLPQGMRKIRAYGFLQRGWQKALELARPVRALAPAPLAKARECPRCQQRLHYALLAVLGWPRVTAPP